MRNEFIGFTILSLLAVGLLYFFVSPVWIWSMIILGPLLFIGWYDMFQSNHAIMRNFPILGRGRYVMESLRPGIQQYFVESDTDGRPFNRIHRNIVYARAKKQLDTTPFGTQLNVYEEGYEWMNHSIASIDPHRIEQHPRMHIGSADCKQPYSASIYNVSAMSFGSLSSAAILALNGGAKQGGFAHNTGEGGISPYHLKPGGDLIYQVGTGYFGCRSKDDGFDPVQFKQRAAEPSVKMIELKLSQGAKPGHGGILPAKKNTAEIANIRGIEPGKDVMSPPYHKEFDTPIGLLELIQKMQTLSDGKPVGFKLCVGSRSEFFAICKAIVKTGIKPDFISVDGGEGGTGAAPLEFSNSVGMPYKEGLAFVYDALVGFDLKKEIAIIASGKILSGFDMFKAFALGADACYSARAMMMALGCIQALECNKNNCPTGVATQDPELVKGLVSEDKAKRVTSFHKETIHSFIELLAAAGLKKHTDVNRSLIYRRVSVTQSERYDQIFPYVKTGAFLSMETCPGNYRVYLEAARAETFNAVFEGV
ncbi:MAG: glutamate synthase domain-containing protein 2 [Polaribacter sp.]|jgi:glutamate synthase domain-containing protein 2